MFVFCEVSVSCVLVPFGQGGENPRAKLLGQTQPRSKFTPLLSGAALDDDVHGPLDSADLARTLKGWGIDQAASCGSGN